MKSYRATFLLFILFFGIFSYCSGVVIQLQFENSERKTHAVIARRRLKKPRIGLALSGGGARGLAHIGALKVLERESIPIDFIAATSMGSVVGGLFASGMSATQIDEQAMRTNWTKIFSNTPQRSSLFVTQKTENTNHIVEFRLKNGRPIIPIGLTAGQELTQLLSELTMEADYLSQGDFNKLNIPFHAVAIDMVRGEKVVIKDGVLAEAMRASLAVPFAFTPVDKDSMLLLDGGLVDNLPIGVVRDMGADFIIAVDVKAPLKPKNQLNNPLQVLDQIVTLTILNHERHQTDSSDILIVPNLKGHLSSDFSSIAELILQGEEAAKKSINMIKQKISMLKLEIPKVEKRVVKEMSIKGNRRLTEAGLLKSLKIALGDTVDERIIYIGLERLYETGLVEGASAEVDTLKEGLSVAITVKENPPWKPVKTSGVEKIPASELLKDFKPAEELVVNWHDYQALKQKILDRYRSRGYLLARIEQEEDQDSVFSIGVNEGKVREISVSGNNTTKRETILRELSIKPGDVFQIQNARNSIRQIYSMSLFSQVFLEIRPGIHLIVHVIEKAQDNIQLGLRYDETRLGEAYARYIRNNLWGSANRWTTHVQYGLRREKYATTIHGDRLKGSYFSHQAGMYIYADKKYFEELPRQFSLKRLRKLGLFFSVGRQIKRLGHLSAIFRTENFLSDSLDKQWQESNLQDFSDGIRKVSFQSVVDDLDRLPFPTSGRKHVFLADFAHDIIGGTERFAHFSMSLGEYYTPWQDHTFYPRISLAYSDQPIPPVEQHSLGGFNHLFSLDNMSFYNAFPFMGFGKLTLPGDCMLLANLRYRWRVMPWMYIFIQYDVGETWQRNAFKLSRTFLSEELEDLRQGIGLGISFDTPIGPITMVGAQALGIKSETERALEQKFYFSLGHEF